MTDEQLKDLNRNSSKPLYLQIYELLSDLLTTGQLKPGDQFPTEQELVERYGVARITVRRAISDMAREGRLVRLAGKGTFVATPKIERHIVDVSSFSSRLESLGLHPKSHVLEHRVIGATPSLAKSLEVQPDDPVLELIRLRFSNDDPVALETSFLSLERCPGIDEVDFTNQSLYETLKSQYSLEPHHAKRTLELTFANEWESQHLKIAKGSPLFLMRAQVNNNNAPLEYAKILLRGDRFRFQI